MERDVESVAWSRGLSCVLYRVAWNTMVVLQLLRPRFPPARCPWIGFGINAVVDSSVSVLLIHRFRAEAPGHAERAARAEERAELASPGSVASWLPPSRREGKPGTRRSERALCLGRWDCSRPWRRCGVPALGRTKLRVAWRLGSRALRARSAHARQRGARGSRLRPALVLPNAPRAGGGPMRWKPSSSAALLVGGELSVLSLCATSGSRRQVRWLGVRH